MVDSNSNTLRDVMKADISLGNSGASNCWTRQMKDAFGDLQNGTVYRSALLQCRKLNISNLRIDLRFRHQAVWREAHGKILARQLLSFKKVCGLSQLVCSALIFLASFFGLVTGFFPSFRSNAHQRHIAM
jgi:hypothetical protein